MSRQRSKAVHVFTVSHGGWRLRVSILPSVSDVHKAFPGGRSLALNTTVHAYFTPPHAAASRSFIGDIVIPADGRLLELVPHEVTHAVLFRFGGVHCSADEGVATAIGVLSARILRRCARLGMEAR